MKSALLVITFFTVTAATAATTKSTAKKDKAAPAPTATSICARLNKAVSSGTAAQKLNKYFTESWNYVMTEYPEAATWLGVPGQNDRWSDNSLAAIERHRKETVCSLEALKKIPANQLKGEDKVSYDLAKLRAETSIEGYKFNAELMPLNHLGGIHTDVPDTLAGAPAVNKKDYEDRIARLEKVPELAAQIEVLMREGMKRGLTPVKMFMSRVPGQFDKLLTEKIEDSALYKPFAEMNKDISAEDQAALRAKAVSVLKEKTIPAFKKMKDFIVTTYIPACTENISLSSMPNGKEWYAFETKRHTTTSLTPDQLHDLGLREVARITKAMEAVKDEVKFKGSLKEFNEHLLKDPKFFYTDKESLMTGFRDIAKRADAQMPKMFKTLPRLPYGVSEMPAYKAAEAPAAYYMGGSLEGGRAGSFEANTTDLKARPKWGMEALTLHEAVPGHHMQIAIAQELKDLPNFRKHEGYTAFVEGWGLYAESLGEEMGFYKDPYSRYGQLSYEIWRAIRLVVDTGIHAKGWTRQQAIDYFGANMPKAKSETENEVDRYITWPGQALAYKVGQLKLLELRARATKELGDKFNVREFHDEVLKHGALPISVLENNVDEWIALQKKGDGKAVKNKTKI